MAPVCRLGVDKVGQSSKSVYQVGQSAKSVDQVGNSA